jgi:hypothetical protein
MTWLGANRDVRLLQEALEAKDREIAQLEREHAVALVASARAREYRTALEEIEANADDAELTPAFMVIVLGKIRAIARKALEGE